MKSYTDENGNLIWYKDSDDIFAKLENLNTECNSYTVAETRYQEVLKEHDDKIRADAIKEYKSKLRKQFIKYYDEHDYSFLSDIIEILDDCEMELKEQSHE